MTRPKLATTCAFFAIGLSLSVNPEIVCGQLSPSTTQTNSATTTPTPGGGNANSTAPFETTLFAYRALSSDAEAISTEVSAVATENHRKIVIGTPTDAASFAQWRAIMGEIAMLNRRASEMHTDLTSLTPYIPHSSLLPASLHLVVNHQGSFAQGRDGQIIVIVGNDPLAGPTVGGIVVSGSALPTGLTLISTPSGAGWDCQPSVTLCTRHDVNDVLQPGASFPMIVIPVKVIGTAQPGPITVTIAASGGGSIATTGSDTPTIQAPPAAGHNFMAVQQPQTTTTPTPAPTPPATPFGTALTAIPTFLQLAQFLGQSFAVNESLSATQGSMADLPLMNMVARYLKHNGVDVFIPSVYTPGLFKGGNLEDTYLWGALHDLENRRVQLWADIAVASEKLNHANFVTLNPTKYVLGDVKDALLYAGEAQSFINSAQSLAANIDSFEASLFGGQSASNSPSTTPTGNATPTGGVGPTGNTAPSGSTSPTNSTSPQSATTPFNGTQATPQAPTAIALATGSGGNILPQILGSDLLAQQIWGSTAFHADNFKDTADGVNFLAVHALESGGSQLSKSNFWYGVHIFFSGGAVTTFSLYEAKGDLVCSGIAYNYRGNVREKHYDAVLRSGPAHDAILNTDFPCPDHTEVNLRIGMPIDDLIRTLGPPEAQSSGIIRYPARQMTIYFKDDRVTRIEQIH